MENRKCAIGKRNFRRPPTFISYSRMHLKWEMAFYSSSVCVAVLRKWKLPFIFSCKRCVLVFGLVCAAIDECFDYVCTYHIRVLDRRQRDWWIILFRFRLPTSLLNLNVYSFVSPLSRWSPFLHEHYVASMHPCTYYYIKVNFIYFLSFSITQQ